MPIVQITCNIFPFFAPPRLSRFFARPRRLFVPIGDEFVETADIRAVALCIYAASVISDSCTIRARQ